jgi:4-hydroxy-tetrahydrodipicolinate reductase
MKIALIGYGKMGKAVEQAATARGHQIVLRITRANEKDFTIRNLQQANVAIEFTQPNAAMLNITLCFLAGIPCVCGTTGWNEKQDTLKTVNETMRGGLFTASNFSVGVHIFRKANQQIAALMNKQGDYNVSIDEVHHKQKLDAPSGTAITLAEDIIKSIERKKNWVIAPEAKPDAITIKSERIDPVPGTHIIKYSSPVDTIALTHTAHTREGFALGAVLAAEFMIGKKGIFGMDDMIP